MKLDIGKIIWGIISSFVFIIYKSDVNAALCNYTGVVSSERVYNQTGMPENDTSFFQYCSASKLCHGGTCGAKFVRLIKELSNYSAEESYIRVCSPGYYLSKCKNANGTTVTSPQNYYDCASDYECTSCPSLYSVRGDCPESRQVIFPQGIYDAGGRSELYFCSYTTPGGQMLDGVYMQVIEISCSSLANAYWNTITDCYIRPDVTMNDGTGSFVYIDSCLY